jgi:hypothetical protein
VGGDEQSTEHLSGEDWHAGAKPVGLIALQDVELRGEKDDQAECRQSRNGRIERRTTFTEIPAAPIRGCRAGGEA